MTPAPRPRYRGFIADSARWERFTPRPGDIVISTPSKCGTTWMQRLVSLLVFDGPDLPAPLPATSLWYESNFRSPEEVDATLDAQQHRRFLKAHVPLDGLPLFDEVQYVVVGRDPRDAWVSMWHHDRNLDLEASMALRLAAVGDEDLADLTPFPEEPEDMAEAYAWAIELDRLDNGAPAHLAIVVHHLRQAWERHHLPNVHLFHYADLTADLPGQLHRLAQALGFDEVDRERAEALARHASLDAMRGAAATTAPEAHLGSWKDPAGFFRAGGGGEWRGLVTPQVEVRYDERVRELTGGDEELAAWIHGGWSALGTSAEQ